MGRKTNQGVEDCRHAEPASEPIRSRRQTAATVSAALVLALTSAATAAGAALRRPLGSGSSSKQVPPCCLNCPGHRLDPEAGSDVGSIAVAMSRPHLASEVGYLQAITTAGNPLAGDHLTPAQFASHFGVPAAQTRAVLDSLTAGCLTIDSVSPHR